MRQKIDEQPAFDPFDAWQRMRDSGIETWSKLMIDLVNSDAYAQAGGALLDTWLTGAAPLRAAIESTIAQALSPLTLPLRSDITRLAERLTRIEMRLDDLAAMLETQPRAATGADENPSA